MELRDEDRLSLAADRFAAAMAARLLMDDTRRSVRRGGSSPERDLDESSRRGNVPVERVRELMFVLQSIEAARKRRIGYQLVAL